jgi:hypothetical protein
VEGKEFGSSDELKRRGEIVMASTGKMTKPSIKTLATAEGDGSDAVAVHVSDENIHLVGIGNLRVIISKDGTGWFAQGLEIDYAASGKTIASTKKNFQEGLKKTIDLHLQVHGGIDKLLKSAPQDVWEELWKGRHYKHTQVSVHDDIARQLGFDEIKYFEPDGVAA